MAIIGSGPGCVRFLSTSPPEPIHPCCIRDLLLRRTACCPQSAGDHQPRWRSRATCPMAPRKRSRRSWEVMRTTDPPSIDPKAIDVLISGHTHAPSLSETERRMASAPWWSTRRVLAAMSTISPRLKGPPVSSPVRADRRAGLRAGRLAPGGAVGEPQVRRPRLSRIQPLLSWGRRPPQPPPDARAHVRSSATV